MNSLAELMSSKEYIALATAFSAIDDRRVRQSVLALVRTLGGGAAAAMENDDAAHVAH
ncbi:hypothetical protein D3C87_2115000 [compost metagenome]